MQSFASVIVPRVKKPPDNLPIAPDWLPQHPRPWNGRIAEIAVTSDSVEMLVMQLNSVERAGGAIWAVWAKCRMYHLPVFPIISAEFIRFRFFFSKPPLKWCVRYYPTNLTCRDYFPVYMYWWRFFVLFWTGWISKRKTPFGIKCISPEFLSSSPSFSLCCILFGVPQQPSSQPPNAVPRPFFFFFWKHKYKNPSKRCPTFVPQLWECRPVTAPSRS